MYFQKLSCLHNVIMCCDIKTPASPAKHSTRAHQALTEFNEFNELNIFMVFMAFPMFPRRKLHILIMQATFSVFAYLIALIAQ